MDTLSAGFWGAYFGTASLMLAASLGAFARSLHRVALLAALTAVVSCMFIVGYLGLLPMRDPDAHSRLLAHVSVVAAVVLGLMLMSLLGMLRPRDRAQRAYVGMSGLGTGVIALTWALTPWQALALGSATALAVGLAMLLASVRSALRGDRLAWAAVTGVACMDVSIAGASWIALHPGQPWPVHAVTAVTAVCYQAIMAYALWSRYSYLLELSEVMAHGPSYDPVTRMRSHSETGQMMNAAFFRREGDTRAVGVIVISIANLYALDNLHGRAAFNHALFVCATRLRRCVPGEVQMGRLTEDGFLLLMRDAQDMEALLRLARQIRERLCRAVALSTARDPANLDAGQATWAADVGVGVLAAGPHMRPSQALVTARSMSRAAWAFASRLAWYDEVTGKIAEVPQGEAD